MKNNQTKCHRFWLTNRNPITMKKCADESKLHIHNQSKEQDVALERWRDNKVARFNYDELEDRKEVILDFMEEKYPHGTKQQESFSDEYQVDYQASLSEYKQIEETLKDLNEY